MNDITYDFGILENELVRNIKYMDNWIPSKKQK